MNIAEISESINKSLSPRQSLIRRRDSLQHALSVAKISTMHMMKHYSNTVMFAGSSNSKDLCMGYPSWNNSSAFNHPNSNIIQFSLDDVFYIPLRTEICNILLNVRWGNLRIVTFKSKRNAADIHSKLLKKVENIDRLWALLVSCKRKLQTREYT